MTDSRPPRYDFQNRRERPEDYDPLVADQIVDRVRNGELLPEICRDDPDMPMPGTFLVWCEQDPPLLDRYRQARRIGNEVNFDLSVVAAHGTDPQLSRVRAEALRWHVERSQPERYGPRALTKEVKPEDDAGAGVDYSAEVRRRIEDMAARRAASGAEVKPS